MQRKKEVIKITVFITSIFVIFLSVTYAFINVTLSGTKRQVITAGDLSLVLEEDENNLTIENALPMYDEVGMIQEDPFTFRLINNSTAEMNFTIKLVDITTGNNKLSTSDVKYYLTKDGTGTPALLSSLSDGVIDSGIISGEQTINYTLRLWIRDGVEDNNAISGKNLSYRIEVTAEQGTVVADANAPVLTSGMIPVTYDEGQASWVKADTSSTWYDYDAQMWANAVTVTEAQRSQYMSAEAGTAIPISAINTMWVWIPRYEYQYTNLGNDYAGGTQDLPGEVKINFISSEQGTPSNNTMYKIPEGFTFGGEELSGFWMGKFETSGSIMNACTNENCTSADVTIVPNYDTYTFAEQPLSTLFYAIRSMQNSTNANKYGFDVIGSGTMDVHMAKNTEWGAVSMLSQSKYGKYGNPNYSGANKEVYYNSRQVAGMSNGSPDSSATSNVVSYDTKDTGYGASTTGTIYGVYDMNGGLDEYVTGNFNGQAGYGGSMLPNNYYDLYTSDVLSTGYKAGDATYETSGWYNGFAGFVSMSNPWLIRTGVFDSNSYDGGPNARYGTRCTIKP